MPKEKVGKKELKRELRSCEWEARRMMEHIHSLEREMFRIWEYICAEGLRDEVIEYLDEAPECRLPFAPMPLKNPGRHKAKRTAPKISHT